MVRDDGVVLGEPVGQLAVEGGIDEGVQDLRRRSSSIKRKTRWPVSVSCRRTQVCRVCAEQPILAAIDSMAAHCDGCLARHSPTRRTACSRALGECFADVFMRDHEVEENSAMPEAASNREEMGATREEVSAWLEMAKEPTRSSDWSLHAMSAIYGISSVLFRLHHDLEPTERQALAEALQCLSDEMLERGCCT